MSATLEQLAAQAEGIGFVNEDLETTATPGEASAAPPITNAQAFAGAIGAAREAFCFFTKLNSPKSVLTDDRVGQLGALWGPVFDKHGFSLGDIMGDYALEFSAVIGTISVVTELRAAVTAEIAQRSAEQAKKDQDKQSNVFDLHQDGESGD